MEELYQEFKDLAAIYIVYISEAHAADDRSPVPYAKEMGITEHTTYGERCAVAERLVQDKKLTIPCLIDNMDNAVATAYQGWPDRVYLIRKDGTLAIAGNRGPWGFEPGLEAANNWLAAYKKTGQEPAPIKLEDKMGETRRISRRMNRAYQDGQYQRAIEFAKKMYDLQPQRSDTIYNIACFYCLLGDTDSAYTWLEKAIDAGYDDADHLLQDDDFKTIRDQERFKGLVRHLREGERAD